MKDFFGMFSAATLVVLPFALWFNEVEAVVAIVSFWIGIAAENIANQDQ